MSNDPSIEEILKEPRHYAKTTKGVGGMLAACGVRS